MKGIFDEISTEKERFIPYDTSEHRASAEEFSQIRTSQTEELKTLRIENFPSSDDSHYNYRITSLKKSQIQFVNSELDPNTSDYQSPKFRTSTQTEDPPLKSLVNSNSHLKALINKRRDRPKWNVPQKEGKGKEKPVRPTIPKENKENLCYSGVKASELRCRQEKLSVKRIGNSPKESAFSRPFSAESQRELPYKSQNEKDFPTKLPIQREIPKESQVLSSKMKEIPTKFQEISSKIKEIPLLGIQREIPRRPNDIPRDSHNELTFSQLFSQFETKSNGNQFLVQKDFHKDNLRMKSRFCRRFSKEKVN